MTSEPNKSWSHVRLLHAAMEGLRKETDTSSVPKGEEAGEAEKTAAASASSEEGQSDGVPGQGESPSPAPLDADSGGVEKERLAQLRSHLQAQFSIREEQEDQSASRHLMELVGRIVRGEEAAGTLPANISTASGGQPCPTCGQCSNPTGCSNGFPVEVEKALQRELAVLKDEVMGSIEAMKREVAEELGGLREALQAFREHRIFQNAELSPLEELDENLPEQLKGDPCRAEGPGAKLSSEERLKSRSVPTLHPLPISTRSQAIMRAMSTTLSARSSFIASLSRSHSDPVEPTQVPSTILPPAIPKIAPRKPPAKLLPPPATKTYASSAKGGSRMAARTVAPHPPSGNSDGKPR